MELTKSPSCVAHCLHRRYFWRVSERNPRQALCNEPSAIYTAINNQSIRSRPVEDQILLLVPQDQILLSVPSSGAGGWALHHSFSLQTRGQHRLTHSTTQASEQEGSSADGWVAALCRKEDEVQLEAGGRITFWSEGVKMYPRKQTSKEESPSSQILMGTTSFSLGNSLEGNFLTWLNTNQRWVWRFFSLSAETSEMPPLIKHKEYKPAQILMKTKSNCRPSSTALS